MGLVIKAALGALVVLLIGILAKTKNYYIAGLIPLFPTFALIAHYIVASERGTEACEPPLSSACGRSFRIFSICCRCGISPGFCVYRWRWAEPWSAGASAPGCYFFLEPFPLAQRTAAVHGKGSAGHVAAGEQIIDKIDHLFLAGAIFISDYSAPAGDTPRHRFR
jgi:hypothetical protein